MSRINIILQVDSVPPRSPDKPLIPMEDRVRKAVESVDNGLDDARECWEFIRRLYNYLIKKEKAGKCSQSMYNILDILSPVMEKYGPISSYEVESREETGVSRDGD
jgi:hypothetical protein